ncbi:MAG TPA: hypothetical protein VL171_15185 [Verrucomicrobiae bacterium]|nr:hypothetical protein [Verrucomicrobiae bacterium]
MKSKFFVFVVAVVVLLGGATATPARRVGRFNQKGNILIADQLNNRVIEVNTNTHAIVWQFGDSGTVAGPTTIFAPHDVERFRRHTLIVCTGAVAGSEPGCAGGCPDSRVILVNRRGRIVWQYGQAGLTGSGTNELDRPVSARFLPHHRYLITDQGNQRVIEVNRKKKIVWQYGTTGVSGSGTNQLNNPDSAERRRYGYILIADQGNNRVIRVNRHHNVIKEITTLGDGSSLSGPSFASYLVRSGHTLITDTLNNRIVEVGKGGSNLFEYVTSARPGSVADPNPARAVRLKKGNTLISDQFNHQVIEIDPTGEVVFAYGTIGVAGADTNELNAPYDAKVVRDFTGLTSPKPPPSHHGGGGGGGFPFPFGF